MNFKQMKFGKKNRRFLGFFLKKLLSETITNRFSSLIIILGKRTVFKDFLCLIFVFEKRKAKKKHRHRKNKLSKPSGCKNVPYES